MLVSADELCHHGIKGQRWGVRRFQKKDGSLTPAGKKRYNDDEYDEERERLEQEVAARRGVKYVRKTKKEREAEDAENERQEKERRSREDAAYKRTEGKMKEIDKKLQAKYDFNSSEDVDKYYKEYDEEWFKILYEERKKEGLSDNDGTIKPKKKSKPVRVAKAFVKSFARDTVTGFATAALINHGHEEVGKMVAMAGGAASWVKLGKDIYDIAKDKD